MAASETLQQTPLHDEHVRLGARMVPFAGFDMPVQYSGIVDEHMAVRQAAGLFDVSHMGEFFVHGPEAGAFVQYLVTNDVTKLYDGRAMYTVMCRENGGIVDDLLVYRLAEDAYMLVVNAANIEKDWNWAVSNNPMKAALTNRSAEIALMALQGPKAFEIAAKITDVPVEEIKYYHFRKLEPGTFFGAQFALLSHTGYTGESGLEIYCDADKAVAVWNALLAAGEGLGLKPAGLGARDTLRLEAGFPLYGNDLSDDTHPLEAGLGWVVKPDAGEFIGREAVLKIKEEGPKRKLVGFVMNERGIPRHGYPLLNAVGEVIGEVTSGSQSPILQQGIGLGYVVNAPEYTTPGQSIDVEVRNRPMAVTVTKPPFHKQK